MSGQLRTCRLTITDSKDGGLPLSLETVRPLSAVRLGYENAASDLKPRTLSIESLNLESQVRAAIDESVISDYAERMAEGVAFPPVVVFEDGERHYGDRR